MRTLKTSEAAALLNVSANTLRAWERRFDYPKPRRSAGGHRLYTYAEITALSSALQEGLSISSAVSIAREAIGADGQSILAALLSFSSERADRAMEASLAMRSLERSVEELLLPALDEVRRRKGPDSSAWAFSAQWASDWLRRAQRFACPPARRASVLVGDASDPVLDPATPHIRALELFCVRAGAFVLSLPVRGLQGLRDAVGAARPDGVVLAGGHVCDDEVARWAYGVRSSAGAVPVALYRRGLDLPTARSRKTVLSPSPARAQRQLLQIAEAYRREGSGLRRWSDGPAGRPLQPAPAAVPGEEEGEEGGHSLRAARLR
ncbi:MAG: MerR family transcriptional regulator [Actinomycetota bacterium]|nr:MerR family transcriptional regulator [Actinomycetota bacterium]